MCRLRAGRSSDVRISGAAVASGTAVRTPAEILEFYEERAQSTASWALIHHDNANVPLALQNWTEAARNRLFRALVGWRTGLVDPIPDLRAALGASEEAVAFLDTTDVGPLRRLFDPVPGAYSAILLDRPDSRAIAEARRLAVWPTPRGLTVDRALEGWLIGALLGLDPGARPEAAAALEGRKRMALMSATYTTYFALGALAGDDVGAATDLTRRALDLFPRRRRDPYYAGGVHYEGGDMYNDIVVDFHLAAIWRVRGWNPSGLPPNERLHVQLPTVA
jgi:hypothetical protein